MTDVRLTQVSAEEWGSGTPVVQATQVFVEEWGTVAEGPVVVPDTGQQARAMVLA